MNEHDQALLDLYELTMAKKIVRLQLNEMRNFSMTISTIMRKMSPEEFLALVKKSNEELKKKVDEVRERMTF